MFGTDRIALGDIEFIETADGVRLSRWELKEKKPEPLMVRHYIQFSIIGDVIELAADIAGAFVLSSAAKSAEAAEEEYWDWEIEKHVEHAKRMSMIYSGLSIGTVIWYWGMGSVLGKEKENYKRFAEQSSSFLRKMGGIISSGSTAVCVLYDIMAVSASDYGKAAEYYRIATLGSILSAAGELLEIIGYSQEYSSVTYQEGLSFKAGFKDGSPFLGISLVF